MRPHPLQRLDARLLLTAGVLGAFAVTAAGAPLPRIAVREGRFVEKDTGRAVAPVGFNYIRLRPRWHGTFAPGRYDADRADAMLADLRRGGFNAVRVFLDPAPKDGLALDAGAPGLSPTYLANVLDFLARATKHRVYVVPSLLMLPPTKEYNELVGRERRQFGHGNEMYFDDGFVRAKARFVADFLAAVKARDAALLPTVLACELDNETHFLASGEPFSRAEGTFQWGGAAYDLARSADCQKLADAAVVRWADACVDAARTVDPDAMVTVNVFTFAAVGRSGPGRLREDKTSDKRFPARPLALTRTKLAYLDIHFYPFDDKTLDRDLASIELLELRAAAGKAGKPLIMGEFGAFRKAWPTLEQAAAAMKAHVARVRGLGFAGWLYWTYDTDEQPFLWNARSGKGEVLESLREALEATHVRK